MIQTSSNWAFKQYERVRDSLPHSTFPKQSKQIKSLSAITDKFDVFLLDAFGVLNIGNTAIVTARQRVSALQASGKKVMVLTNGATLASGQALAKYRRLGYRFCEDDIISSRATLKLALEKMRQGYWGVMAADCSKIEELQVKSIILKNNSADFDKVCGFILLSSLQWTNENQALLIESLRNNPRPVIVGNPDIVAPHEDGLSLEPGFFAHQLTQLLGIEPIFFGKPFNNIFDLAFTRLNKIEKNRVLMVGDTLHTDILGGKSYGLTTALVTDFGVYSNENVTQFTNISGINPDYIMPTI